MMLLRQRTREVYRLYDEDEFLQAEAAQAAVTAAPPRLGRIEHEDVGAPADRRLRRLAGLAVLTGAIGAVGGLVAMSGLGAAGGSYGRRAAGRRPATLRDRATALAAAGAPVAVVATQNRRAARRPLAREGGAKAHPRPSRSGRGRLPARSRPGTRAGGRGHILRSAVAVSLAAAGPALPPEPSHPAGGELDAPRQAEFGFEGGAGT
jgi:hypothetical protein